MRKDRFFVYIFFSIIIIELLSFIWVLFLHFKQSDLLADAGNTTFSDSHANITTFIILFIFLVFVFAYSHRYWVLACLLNLAALIMDVIKNPLLLNLTSHFQISEIVIYRTYIIIDIVLVAIAVYYLDRFRHISILPKYFGVFRKEYIKGSSSKDV